MNRTSISVLLLQQLKIEFAKDGADPTKRGATRISDSHWLNNVGQEGGLSITRIHAEDGNRCVYLWTPPQGPQAAEVAAHVEEIVRLMESPDLRAVLAAAENTDEFRDILARALPFRDRELENTARQEVVGRTGFLFGGVAANIRTKLPHYKSDFLDGLNAKSFAAIIFIYFACLAPAIAFGGLVSALTGGQLGAVEMLVSTTVCGVIYALFAAQPLTILGSTGPVIVFLGLLFDLCQRWTLPFLPTLGWVGLWTSLILIILAATEVSRLIRWFTRFTDEIFAALISLIFIAEALGDSLRGVRDLNTPRDTAFLAVILALGTYVIAMQLAAFRRSPYLRAGFRNAFADFGPVIALSTMVVIAILMRPVQVDTLALPTEFGTTSGRPWLVDLWATPLWARMAALLPALLVSVLLFVDQNITVRLVNSRKYPLLKGFGYHLDLLIVGVLVGVCSLFGLPWMVAATVRSLNHVQSLATTERRSDQEVVVAVRENRFTGLAVHLLIGVSLLFLDILRDIPMPVLFGLFLYMGVASLTGNQLFERMLLWLTDPKLYPSAYYLKTVPHPIVRKFTMIQLGMLVLLWILKSSVLGILFPLLVAGLVPIRLMLPRWFDAHHLAHLDGEEEPEEEMEGPLGP